MISTCVIGLEEITSIPARFMSGGDMKLNPIDRSIVHAVHASTHPLADSEILSKLKYVNVRTSFPTVKWRLGLLVATGHISKKGCFYWAEHKWI